MLRPSREAFRIGCAASAAAPSWHYPPSRRHHCEAAASEPANTAIWRCTDVEQANPAEPVSPGDPHTATPSGKPRARSLEIPFGGVPGRWNAITDVPGVQVGYTTLIRGESVRTGVTAILPRGAAGAGDPVAAGFCSQNGNGEMTGVSWIAES